MLDHVAVEVFSLARSMAFYDAVLAPVGFKRLHTYDGIGYGRDAHATFWINPAEAPLPAAGRGTKFAFEAPSRHAVDAFHAGALAQGGADGVAPGFYPDVHPHYYAAFVVDPDGLRLEAVCHRPEDLTP